MARRSSAGSPATTVLDLLGDGEIDDLALDIVPRLDRFPGVALLPPLAGRLGPQQVDGAAVGLGQEVGPQAAALGVEALRAVPEPEEDLLQDLLGQHLVVEQAPGEGEGGAGVAPVGLGQRVLAPSPDGDDERRIAGVPEALQRHTCLSWHSKVATHSVPCSARGVPPDGSIGLADVRLRNRGQGRSGRP